MKGLCSLYNQCVKLSKYPWIKTIGVPLSPLPEVKSDREPIRSVRLRGVVPWASIEPTRSSSLLSINPEMAFFNSSPRKSAKLLSARYFNFTSFGLPTSPGV